MRTRIHLGIVAVCLVSCSDGETIDCRHIATKTTDPPTCRVSVDGLYINPASNCIEVWGDGFPSSGLCQSIGTETATIRASYIVDGVHGLIVTRTADVASPVCEFRPCL